MVRGLLALGADPNIRWKDKTPAHDAIAIGNEESLRTLLQGGADTEADSDAHPSLLSYASHDGDAKMVALLLEYGASVDKSLRFNWRTFPAGSTPLFIAVVVGRDHRHQHAIVLEDTVEQLVHVVLNLRLGDRPTAFLD